MINEQSKLIHGDCLTEIDKFQDESIDLIVTDPPYGMSFQSNFRKEQYKPIENDNSLDWTEEFFEKSYRVLKPDTHIYCFCSFHHVDSFKRTMQRFFNVKNILIWQKNNTSMGDLEGDYAPQYEMILFGAKGRRLLNGSRDSNIVPCYRTGNKIHPTQKPVELMSYFIEKSSDRGEVVLDPFMGSGTTPLAALQVGRRYVGIEKDGEYYRVAYERIANAQLGLFV